MTAAYRYQDPGDRIPARSLRVAGPAWSDEEMLVQVVGRLPARPRRVVDVGGGDGRLLPVLAAIADEVVLVEPDRTRLAHAARQAAAEPSSITNVTFVEQDAATFASTPPAPFDLALCSHVIQHVSRPRRRPVLAALRRLLGHDGHALVTFPAAGGARSRYLVSNRVADGPGVTTREVTPSRFDLVADAARSDGPSMGLPVWHAPVRHVVRGLRRVELDVREVTPYRPFHFDLHDPDGTPRQGSAVDTAVLATVRRSPGP